MTEGTITLEGKEYKYKFGMKQIRLFMQAYKMKAMTEYWVAFQDLAQQTPDSYTQIAKALRTAIKSVGDGKGLPKDNDDLVDALFASGSFEEVLAALMASFPKVNAQPAPSGKS